MKIRTTKVEIAQMLDWYASKLIEKYWGRLITPAVEYQMKDYLAHLQQHKLRTEKNRVWEIPVELHYEPPGTNISVGVKDYSNVLLLDFDR